MLYNIDLIVSRGRSRSIKNRLETGFSWLRERGFKLVVKEYSGDPYIVLMITLAGPLSSEVFIDEDIIYIFQHQLAENLADVIMNDWENTLIKRYVTRYYKRMNSAEQLELAERAELFLRRCNDNDSINLLLKFGRKNKITHSILELYDSVGSLNLEGLVNFRLHDYKREIRFAVDIANEDLKSEKQYNDFVKLLKYFVENQPPRTFEVNVLIKENGLFDLWDGRGEAIEEDFIDLYQNDLIGGSNNLDDVLISMLITIAPRRIVLHTVGSLPDIEPIRIIRSVFREKIFVCTGCERCYNYRFGDK